MLMYYHNVIPCCSRCYDRARLWERVKWGHYRYELKIGLMSTRVSLGQGVLWGVTDITDARLIYCSVDTRIY